MVIESRNFFSVMTVLIMVMFMRIMTIMRIMMIMLVIIVMVVVSVLIVMMVLMLHSLNNFLVLYAIPQNLDKINHFHVLVPGILDYIINPFIALAADINENVRLRNLRDVLYARRIAVQVNAVIQKKSKLHIVGILPDDLSCPVIFRENRSNNFEFVCFSLCLFCKNRTATKSKQNARNCKNFIYLHFLPPNLLPHRFDFATQNQENKNFA